jgi:hypothetical protein
MIGQFHLALNCGTDRQFDHSSVLSSGTPPSAYQQHFEFQRTNRHSFGYLDSATLLS